MEITTDVILRGAAWDTALEKLSPIFTKRTNYDIFILSLAIGIMYDQRIERFDDDSDTHTVPRNVIQNQDNGKLDFFFQAMILSTRTEEYTEEDRLKIAFGEKNDVNRILMLTQFANFGVTKLVEKIGDTTVETMENLKNFMMLTVEGENIEIDALPDEILLINE